MRRNILLTIILTMYILAASNIVVAAMTVTDPGAYARFADQLKQLQQLQGELQKMNSMLGQVQQGSGNMQELIALQQQVDGIYGEYTEISGNMNRAMNIDYGNMDVEQLLNQSQELGNQNKQAMIQSAEAQGIVVDKTANNLERMRQLEQSSWGNDSVVGQGQVTNAMLSSIGQQISMMSVAMSQQNTYLINRYMKEEEQAKIEKERIAKQMTATIKINP